MDPLKDYRYCLRCGVETKNEGNMRECKSCGYIFYINPNPAVSALIISGTNILLTKRAVDPYKGKLDIPGGFVELNETLEDAVRREVHEELGVEIRDLEYFNSVSDRYLFSGFDEYILNVNFKVSVNSEDFKPADDISDAIYYPLDGINFKDVAFPSMVEVLKMLRKHIVY